MAITEKEMENYEELFKNIEFSKEDEELKEIILNFALNEAQEQDNLDKKTRQMVIIAATIATQTKKMYEVFVNSALNVGVSPVEIKEILYQSVPYVGILKVLDLLEPTNRIFKDRGIELPLEKQGTTTIEDIFDK